MMRASKEQGEMLRILSLLALLLAGISLFDLAPAKAQHFSFEFGHHGGWHDHGWHDHWAPPPHVVYVSPPPRVQPVYVVPQASPNQYNTQMGIAVPSRGTPTTTVAAPRKNSTKPASRVAIRNACGKGVSVAFLVDGKDVELEDGATQVFTASGTRIVEFDRGDQFGSARYDLTPGGYEFTISESGWQLRREESVSSQTAAASGIKKNSLPTNR